MSNSLTENELLKQQFDALEVIIVIAASLAAYARPPYVVMVTSEFTLFIQILQIYTISLCELNILLFQSFSGWVMIFVWGLGAVGMLVVCRALYRYKLKQS